MYYVDTLKNKDKQPSKFHVREYGGWVNNHYDNQILRWIFDTSHKDLIPTKTVNIDGTIYCAHCGYEAYSIQGNLNKRSIFYSRGDEEYYYKTTGYCCTCPQAIKEMKFIEELEQLKNKHEQEINELNEKYKSIFQYKGYKRIFRNIYIKLNNNELKYQNIINKLERE